MIILKGEPSHRHRFCDENIGLLDSIFVRRERRHPGCNRGMFEKDFSRLFHYNNRRNGNLFEVVSNDEELTKQLLVNVIKMRYSHSPHPIDETIRELVEEIAQSLIGYGRAYYFLHEDKEQKKICLASFSSSGLVRLFGMYIQWLPKCTQKHWDSEDEKLPRELRLLDTAKVIRFDMPTSIKRMLSAQNKTLAVLDKHQFDATNFHPLATHENPNPTIHFDFSVWNSMQERALYRATKKTGWNKTGASKCSDFFNCHRLIRFRKNQLLLRDNILSQLSAELSRVGKNYTTEFSVEISGTVELPSVAYLDELEMRLAREEVGFKEVINYCWR